MNPITNIRQVLENWEYFERSEIPLFAFILYTDEDENTAEYIKEYFWNLHALSSKSCIIFLIDKPRDPVDKKEVQKYLIEVLSRILKGDPTAKNLYSNIPYDKTQAYKIAEFFGIPPNKLPCLVFFSDIYDSDLVIFQLNEKWSNQEFKQQFRNIFSIIQATILKSEMDCTDPDDEEYQSKLKKQLLKYVMKEAAKNKVEMIITHPITKTIADILKLSIPKI